jgi:hypothetical protein
MQTGAADLRRDLHPGSAHASLIVDEASRPGTRSREPDGWTSRLSRRHVPGTRRPSPPSLAGSLIGCSSSRIGSCVTSGAPRTGRLDPDPGWGLDRCMGRRAPHAWLLRRLADPTGGHHHRGHVGKVQECANQIDATVVAGGRLYLFTMMHSRADARAWFDAFTATVRLTPEDAAAPTSAPSS